MIQIRLHLFGQFRVTSTCELAQNFGSRKSLELFLYLFLYRHRAHHRDKLATILWPDQQESRAKQYLRKALWQLQNALESLDESPLQISDNWLQYANPGGIWIDVLVLESAFRQLQRWQRKPFPVEQLSTLQQALDLYHGDLLEGWYEDWCLCERERLLHIFLTLNDHLMHHYEACGEYEIGIGHGLTILGYDLVREQTHRQLMRLRYLAGDRIGALRQFEQCHDILQQELQVLPSRRTQRLYAQIQNDAMELNGPPSEKPGPAVGQQTFYELMVVVGVLQQSVDTLKQLLHHKG